MSPPSSLPIQPTSDRSPAPVIAAFGLLLLASIAAVIVASIEGGAASWVSHTREVQEANLRLLFTVQNAITTERGYLITGDGRYLDGYRDSKATIPVLERRLRDLTSDNVTEQKRLSELSRVTAGKMAELDSTIALKQAGRDDAVAAAVRRHLVMDTSSQIRVLSNAIDAEEANLLDQRESRLSLYRQLLIATIAVAIAAWFALVLIVTRRDRRNFARLREQNLALAGEIELREIAEAQLRQAQKMEAVGQLTGGIAHDFNNMLQIVIANLDMLGRRLDDPPERRKTHVDQALEGARRAAALTQSLLAFSRQQPLDPKPVDVNRVVADMSRLLRSTLGESVTIETVQGGGLWPAFVDRPQFESALLNLAVNARDAMAGNGKLTIETANAYLDDSYAASDGTISPGQYVLVALTDTGSGMPDDVLAKAFDPFFTTKGPGAGTGLGLSQVHGFIKQSGGHVKIYSERGVGTTVKLYLPRAGASRQGDSAAGPVSQANAFARGVTVLVVEDDALVRATAAESLRDLGHQVIEASGVAEAFEQIDSHPEIQLVLTDVVMPEANGRALADAIAQRRPGLPVVFMTGYTRNAIVHNGVLDPGAFLITKPFTAAQLGAKVQEALAAASAPAGQGAATER